MSGQKYIKKRKIPYKLMLIKTKRSYFTYF